MFDPLLAGVIVHCINNWGSTTWQRSSEPGNLGQEAKFPQEKRFFFSAFQLTSSKDGQTGKGRNVFVVDKGAWARLFWSALQLILDLRKCAMYACKVCVSQSWIIRKSTTNQGWNVWWDEIRSMLHEVFLHVYFFTEWGTLKSDKLALINISEADRPTLCLDSLSAFLFLLF